MVWGDMPIVFDNVTYIYNKGTPMEKAAIRGVSLSISEGEFIAVSGNAGSGKSTFLQLLGGLLKPASGSITSSPLLSCSRSLSIRERAGVRVVRGILCNGVGVVFQSPEKQFFDVTVYGDLSFPLRRAGVPEEEIEERAREALGSVDIDFQAYRDRSPFELSGGEKRRVAIAAILALDPEVIALDEPLAGLDSKGKSEIIRELKRLQREKGKTVVIATQEWDTVSRVCDRVVLLENGGLAGDGRADIMKERISGMSPIPSLVKALRRKGVDLGEGVFDAGEALLRIKGEAEKVVDTNG